LEISHGLFFDTYPYESANGRQLAVHVLLLDFEVPL